MRFAFYMRKISDSIDLTEYENVSPSLPLPSWQTTFKHIGLLILTFLSVTVAGTLFPFGPLQTLPEDDPQTFSEIAAFIVSLPGRYADLVSNAVWHLFNDAAYLSYGVSFSLSLLFILIAHEMGHYIACRIYRVDSTLPFFIPTPPLFGPAGTLGAFIKIRSPMPSRKAVFDIGVAGPIAGFIALLPIAFYGIWHMEYVLPQQTADASGLIFGDPLLIRLIAAALNKDLAMGAGNPFLFAAWVGMLVTALNLIPSGQLDGGHAIFAVFGEKLHYWTGRAAFAVMAVLAVVGWFVYTSPSGILVAVLLGIMMRIGHPIPWDNSPLGGVRLAVAFITLVIFILCFLPFPIQVV